MKKLKKKATDKIQEEILEELKPLTAKAQKHLESAFSAVEPCLSCTGRYKDEKGKCGYCHGTGARPNDRQRNWATQEIYDRFAPKLKPIEITQKDSTDIEDFEKDIEKELDSGVTLEQLMEKYGVTHPSNSSNSKKES